MRTPPCFSNQSQIDYAHAHTRAHARTCAQTWRSHTHSHTSPTQTQHTYPQTHTHTLHTHTTQAGTELVLRKCPSKLTKGQKWTKTGKNQWRNEHKQCMEYDTKAKKFVQKECAKLASSDKKSRQQWVFKYPASTTCAAWGKKWMCGKNWVLDTKKDLTCYGATDAKCANVCCKPAQTCQSAGFSKKCPAGFKYV